MAGYFTLSTLNHRGGEWVGNQPSEEPPPAWSLRVDPSSQEDIGQNFKIKGNLCANFPRICTFFGYFGQLLWV